MRVFKITLMAAGMSLLSGCWFAFIPGSLLEPGNLCVGPSAKVGDRIRHRDGRLGTVKAIYNTSSRCTPEMPVKADVTFD